MRYAELELSLRTTDGHAYLVAARLRLPGSAVEADLLAGAPAAAELDPAALLALQRDPDAYGRRLAAGLFADPRLRAAFAQARARAEADLASLRVALALGPADAALHQVRWELLHDPEAGGFLFAGERVLLARYLLSPDLGPLGAKQSGALRALVAVAGPSDAAGFGLRPVAVAEEAARAGDALADIPTTTLARGVGAGPATLEALLAALRDGPDLLYLVCHGTAVEGRSYLWLEREDGSAHRVEGGELARRIAALARRPLLVVLAACATAAPDQPADPRLLAGPQLAAAGVAAVIAMQGSVSVATVGRFMPALFRELRRDGAVDRAVAAARAALLDQPDWWTPVLFLRLRDGQIFGPDVLPRPACPYPGMSPFQQGDAPFFHGRAAEVDALLQRLRHHPLILVIGPSGSGKSSLVNAGLLSRLPASGLFPPGHWLVRGARLADAPLERLGAALAGPLDRPAEAVRRLLAAHPPAGRLLLIVDQFEELFTLGSADDRRAVVALLGQLQATGSCTLLLVMRADFYPDLMSSALWPIDQARRVEVAPLRGPALRAAIERPAEAVGVSVEPALVERLIADAADEPGSLPLVQETLFLLWSQMEGRRLALAAYERLGADRASGLATAIAARADATLAGMDEAQRRIARRIFLRLIQFGEGRADTRRQQEIAALRSSGDDPASFDATLGLLAASRLLTLGGESDDDGRRVDIAHEALIGGWPLLGGWVEARREAEQSRRRLEAKVAEWERLRESQGGLLDEAELIEAERWLASADAVDLGQSDRLAALVQVSRGAIERARQERESARSWELVQARALAKVEQARADEQAGTARILRETVRRRNLIVALSVGAACLVGLVAVGLGYWAVRATASADALRLAARAEELAPANPEQALLLAVAAEQIMDTDEAQRAIDAALYAFPPIRASLAAGDRPVTSLSWSPDGALLAAATDAGELLVWEPAPARLAAGAASGATVGDPLLAWAGEGQLVALSNGAVTRWDDPRQGEPVTDNARFDLEGADLSGVLTYPISWSPDRSLVAARGERGGYSLWTQTSSPTEHFFTLWEWDGAAARLAGVLDGHRGMVSAVAFSPDSRRFASGGADGAVIVWDGASRQALTRLSVPGGMIEALSWRPDGAALAGGGRGTPILIWDPARAEPITQIAGQASSVDQLAWSPDGARLAAAHADHSVVIYDPATGEATLRLPGHTTLITSLAWSPDGAALASGDAGGRVLLWDLLAWPGNGLLPAGGAGVSSVAWSPDGATLASGADGGEIALWDARAGRPTGRLMGHGGFVASLAWSPDGRRLASGSRDNSVIIWAVGRAEPEHVLSGHAEGSLTLPEVSPGDPPSRIAVSGVTEVAWSPDGLLLASVGEDGRAIIWDATTGQQLQVLGQGGEVEAVAWAPAGDRLVSADDAGRLVVWELAGGAGREVARIEAHPEAERALLPIRPASSVAWSADGRQVAASFAGGLALYDGQTFEREARLSYEGGPFAFHAVSFHPGGDTVVGVTAAGVMLSWDRVTGRLLGWFTPDSLAFRRAVLGRGEQSLGYISANMPMDIAWSPDGGHLAIGMADGSLRLIRAEQLLPICSWVSRNLTRAEWGDFMPWYRPYRPVCANLPSDPAP